MSHHQFENQLIDGFDKALSHSGVSGERLASRLSQLFEIGLTAEGGSHRIGFSSEERKAKGLVTQWMKEAGLQVREDEAGNVFGRLAGQKDAGPTVMSGSHVDTVPNGGHFDGTLGVLAALEVVEAWNETGYQPFSPFEVAIFSDEEGARFNKGLTGSEAFTGAVDVESLKLLNDFEGLPAPKVFESDGLSIDHLSNAKADFNNIKAFVEVHIEQGKRLEAVDEPVGVVTGIAGPCWIKFHFQGSAGHAGNTPMDDRHDALVAASELVFQVPSLPSQVSDSAVATVGKFNVSPNGVNVIPGEIEFYVDVRDINEATRDKLVDLVVEHAEAIAEKHNIKIDHEITTKVTPVPISEDMQEVMCQAARDNDFNPILLPSGAGHDALIVGRHIPIAMLFVRSKDGISHHPEEWSSLSDCVSVVHVLKHALEQLTSE
ncbi:M20 family metallo-hydrolase [Tuberibacillus sp. Marseille-P3662]|uniref:M20 family metallo-hydrolase n=1 Tax=Tuberibacillus sp. Marseille-P3662 TaxID=1965358 RepID=UPI000A1CA6EF|nr:M20 family metallo-hydrolase [Tuberibacillus sp. Marseille-P3662]